MRAFLALLFLAAAIGANALLFFRPQAKAAPEAAPVRVELAGRLLVLPRAYLREPAQRRGGPVARLDAVARLPDLAPLPAPEPGEAFRLPPATLGLVLTAAGHEPGAAERFQKVYARFLAPEAAAAPGGLVARRFRKGTPFEDRMLYMGAGSPLFIALCPADPVRQPEPCLAQLRDGPIDIELRLPVSSLPGWRKIGSGALALVASWRS